MRKNSKVYYLTNIRKNAGKVIEELQVMKEKKGIHVMCYDEAHSLLNYFQLVGGKKYPLKYLKEQEEYSIQLLETFQAGKNIYNIF